MQQRKRASPWAPSSTAASYRDVLRFEQRLVQNAERLQQQRKKYELFLLGLVMAILTDAYYVFLEPSMYSLIRYLRMGLLMILVTALILFFATGIYSEKIARAYKFVPQANRSLRPFNMYLNARRPKPWYLFGFFGSTAPRTTVSSTSASPARSPTTSPERGSSISVAPLKPPVDPHGELIFSNRVDPSFRDGYAAFRSEWKRRRSGSKGGGALHFGPSSPLLTQKEDVSSPPPSLPSSVPPSPSTKPTSRSRSPSPLSISGSARSPRSIGSSVTDEESGPPSPHSPIMRTIDLPLAEKGDVDAFKAQL